MAPFALVDREAAKAIWFALSAGLLTAFVRWSVRALPERRRSERALLWLTVLFMAKFYAHELTLGQTNILLGVSARRIAPRRAGRSAVPRRRADWRGGVHQALRPASPALARVHLWRRGGRCARRRCLPPVSFCRPWSTAGLETSINS